jgi:hypothetical protein
LNVIVNGPEPLGDGPDGLPQATVAAQTTTHAKRALTADSTRLPLVRFEAGLKTRNQVRQGRL